jgi:large subunit ribosomal protein L5
MPPRLLERYNQKILPALSDRLGRTNRLSLPRLEKIVINMGVGAAVGEKKYLEEATDALTRIAGQKPIITRARKSVAGFRVRQGMPIGCKVTLRGRRMYEFFDRLISLAVPRLKDFRGLPNTSFDRQGNYSFGVAEQGIFPEINMSEAQYAHGFNFNFVFNNSDADKSRFVLAEMGVPFRESES